MRIKTPTLLLDEIKCKNNIEKMVLKAQENNVSLRPHFKTHQSLEIGEWFKEYGITQITVSSLTMADYFSILWQDITVAFPVNILEIDKINDLTRRVRLNLLVESMEVLSFLKKHLKRPVGVFLKIDVGYNRSGIDPQNQSLIESLLHQMVDSQQLLFKGFLAHAGHTYDSQNLEEVIQIQEESIEIMARLKEKYLSDFPDAIISLGDTPSCSIATNFSGVDEIRPGNFVFYDLTQEQIGSNSIEEIAVALACPIVAKHKDKLIIYGGGVHLSKDSMEDKEYGTIYGKVAGKIAGKKVLGWTDVIPGIYVSKISQEHGTVKVPESKIADYKVGDYLLILPVHSCMTANLVQSYLTTDNRQVHRL